MKVLILGVGLLGGHIHKAFKDLGRSTDIVSIRAQSSSVRDLVSGYDIIVDCMDPASSNISGYRSCLDEVMQIRQEVHRSSSLLSRIYYLSSSMVYCKSRSVIDEQSETINKSACSSKYVKHKLYVESDYVEKTKNCSIFRTTALVPDQFEQARSSFFNDLLLAKSEKYRLTHREGDEEIVSYIGVEEAACKIANLIIVGNHGELVNICNGSWASRKELKDGVPHNMLDCSMGHRITSRFSYIDS